MNLCPADPVLPTLSVLLLSVSQMKAGNNILLHISRTFPRWILDRPLYVWVQSSLNVLFHSQSSLLNISWVRNLCSTKPSALSQKALPALDFGHGAPGSTHQAGKDWTPLGQQSEERELATPLFVRKKKAPTSLWGSSHSRLTLLLKNQFQAHLKNLKSHSPDIGLLETMFRLATLPGGSQSHNLVKQDQSPIISVGVGRLPTVLQVSLLQIRTSESWTVPKASDPTDSWYWIYGNNV